MERCAVARCWWHLALLALLSPYPIAAQASDTVATGSSGSLAIVATMLPETGRHAASMLGGGVVAAYDVQRNVRLSLAWHRRRYPERAHAEAPREAGDLALVGADFLMLPRWRQGPIPFVTVSAGVLTLADNASTLHWRIGAGFDFNIDGPVRPRLEIGVEPHASHSVLFGVRLVWP